MAATEKKQTVCLVLSFFCFLRSSILSLFLPPFITTGSFLPSSSLYSPFPTDPKICTLTPNGHLDLSPLPPGLFPGERLTFALGSRKNSVISLGRANLEQRAVVSGKDCKEIVKLKKIHSCCLLVLGLLTCHYV